MNTLREAIILFLTLVILLFLDIIRPLHDWITVEFLFLGIIFFSLHRRLALTLPFSFIFGYIKDALLPQTSNYTNTLEFLFISLGVSFLLAYFQFFKKSWYAVIFKSAIVILILVMHVIVNSMQAGIFLLLFSLKFIVQSSLLLISLEYLLNYPQINKFLKPILCEIP